MSFSEIGFGAWGIGGAMWKESKDEESIAALGRAIDDGVNFIDTALAYGDGYSESLVASVVKRREEQTYVATKIPPKNYQWPAARGTSYKDAFPAKYIIECTEKSLRNLHCERLDLQQLHVWTDEWVEVDEIWQAVDRLKSAGKILAFGISINDHDPGSAIKAAATGLVDSFQVIYNIFDQSPEDELFPYCLEHGIGIIARVPFDEGGLTGSITPETTFPEGDWRNRYFRGERKNQVRDRVEKLRGLLGKEAGSLPELALRFCLSHPAVTTVIPGMRTAAHAAANAAVSDGRLLSDELRQELRKHRWQRNFYEE